MPQAQDIVIKNGAATPVDKTFSLLSPAAGDGSVASYALKEGASFMAFPSITASARTTSGGRKAVWRIVVPDSYTDVNGVVTVTSRFLVNIEVSVPSTFAENKKSDAVAFLSNLASNSLFRASVRDGLPTT